MKKPLRVLSALILAAAMLLSLFGCSAKGRSDPQTTSPTESADPKPAESDPAQAAPSGSDGDSAGSYDLDRNNVDLSSYDLQEFENEDGSLNALFEAIPVLKAQYDSEKPSDGEVWTRFFDLGYDYTVESRIYSFGTKPLPEYDEAKEKDYFFNGSAISFKIFNSSNSNPPELINGRNITDEYDHAFVLKNVVQKQYVPYEHKGGPLRTRLVIRVANESGVIDTFMISEDLHVLHFEGELDEVLTDGSRITDISVEPVQPGWFFKLASLAVHYLHGEKTVNNDLFGLFRHQSFQGDNEAAISDLYEHAVIELEYNGIKKTLDDYEQFRSFILLFGEDPAHCLSAVCSCADISEPVSPDGALKVSVCNKPDADPSEDDRTAEFYVLPDGRVLSEKYDFSACTYFGTVVCYFTAKTRMTYTTETAYPFDEMTAFVK